MYTRKILHFYKIFLKLCTSIACISLDWDAQKGCLTSVKSPRRLYQFKVHLTIAVVHNVFLIVSLLSRNISEFGIAYHMLAIYFTIGYIMCNGCRVVCWLNEKEIIKLVNAQGDMERKLLDKDSFGRSDTASEKKAKGILKYIQLESL